MNKKIVILIFILIFCVNSSVAQEQKQEQQEEFNYDSKGKRDPLMQIVDDQGFIVSIVSSNGVGDLNLEGILYGEGGDKFAVINSSVFEEGDLIGEYQVVTIEETKVILSKGNEELVLELEEEGE